MSKSILPPPNEMQNMNANIYQPPQQQQQPPHPQNPNQSNQNANQAQNQPQAGPMPSHAIRPNAPFQTYNHAGAHMGSGGPQANRVMQPGSGGQQHRPQQTYPPQAFTPALGLHHQKQQHQQAVAAANAALGRVGPNNSIHTNPAAVSAHQAQAVHHHQQTLANHAQQAIHHHQQQQQQAHQQHAAAASHRNNAGGPPHQMGLGQPGMPLQYMQYMHFGPNHNQQFYLQPQPSMMYPGHHVNFNPQLDVYQQLQRGFPQSQQQQQPLASMSNNLPPNEMSMNVNATIYQPQGANLPVQVPPNQQAQPGGPQQAQPVPHQQGPPSAMTHQPHPHHQQPPMKYPEPRPLTHSKPRTMMEVRDEDGNLIDLSKFQKVKPAPKKHSSSSVSTDTDEKTAKSSAVSSTTTSTTTTTSSSQSTPTVATSGDTEVAESADKKEKKSVEESSATTTASDEPSTSKDSSAKVSSSSEAVVEKAEVPAENKAPSASANGDNIVKTESAEEVVDAAAEKLKNLDIKSESPASAETAAQSETKGTTSTPSREKTPVPEEKTVTKETTTSSTNGDLEKVKLEVSPAVEAEKKFSEESVASTTTSETKETTATTENDSEAPVPPSSSEEEVTPKAITPEASSPTNGDTSKDEGDDEENELEEGELPDDSEAEASLSRNSSQSGPKVYERDLLLKLRDNASDYAITVSNQENLKDIVKRAGNNKNMDMFLPSFANSGGGGGGGGRSMNDSFRTHKSQNQQSSRRPSQPSKNYNNNNSNNNQDNRSRKITSTSLHYNEQLYKPAVNAWRPGQTKATDDPVEAETEALLKSVRAILNKLTPQNYQTLLEQFKGLKIDSRNRLSRVIGLIFDKAVKEPSFVVQYAGFCSELIHIKVVEQNERGETVDVKFKNLLIEKCQETFFREMYSDVENYDEMAKAIEECEDEKKKKELEDIFDDEKRFSRRRSIGNIKLIAELYKLNMLNAKIMFACFQNLLKHQHEEYVECLCALITNIGANLSSAIKNKPSEQDTFDDIFAKLKAIYDQKPDALKVSSRIRFTILDLLDLKKSNWVSRKKADGPKTIAQVHEDMDQETRRKNMEAMEFTKKKRMAPPNPDEWQQVNRSRGKSGPSISQSKINISSFNALRDSLNKPTGGMSAGSPFGAFAHGSHGGTSNSQSRNSSSNFEPATKSNSTNSVQDGDKPTPAQRHGEKLFELCMMGNEELEDVKEDEVGPNADKETLRKVYCALIYKCVKYYMSEKSKNDPHCEPKLLKICSYCSKSQAVAEDDFLLMSIDVYKELEFPPNVFNDVLTIFFQNKLISEATFSEVYNSKACKTMLIKESLKKFALAHNFSVV